MLVGGACAPAAKGHRVAAQLPPTLGATLTAEHTSAATGQSVGFKYSVSPSSTAPEAAISSATIDFGDGQTYNGGSAGPAQVVTGTTLHVYSSPGAYTVTLHGTADDGETGLATVTVTVTPKPAAPTLRLQADPTNAGIGQPVSFSFGISGGSGISLQISYGDGAAERLDPPSTTVSHAYSTAGTYQVFLAATDSTGRIAGAASTIVQVGP
jgi:PKD repeat protein